jgi:predicted dehydrogenase
MALESGKPVYVDMPAACDRHTAESLAAAVPSGRLWQANLPSRSMAGIRQAIAFLHAGKLGTIHLARAVSYRRDQSTDTAALLGKLIPLLDLARWGLGVDKHPFAVTALGGRFTGGSRATPDSMAVSFAFAERRLLLEVRSLPSDPIHGIRTGVVFHGARGALVCTAADSAVAYGPDGELLRVFKGSGDPIGNFLRAARDGQPDALRAPLTDGLASGVIAALSLQAVAQGAVKPLSTSLAGLETADPETHDCFSRLTAHLIANRVPAQTLCRVGNPTLDRTAGSVPSAKPSIFS